MRAAARIAKAPPTTAINVTTLPADGDEPPDASSTSTGESVPLVVGANKEPSVVGEAVGLKSMPRSPSPGVGDDEAKLVDAADGELVSNPLMTVGAIENPRDPGVGEPVTLGMGAAVGELV